MKIEIGKDFPQYFKPAYPEEFDLFSHFEVTAENRSHRLRRALDPCEKVFRRCRESTAEKGA